ncbi:hypothetical protein ES703_99887 [subsurface metagenome]
MTTTQPSATLATYSINLINEDNARGITFSLVKEVTHPGGTNADKHLDEFTAADRKERHPGFTSYSPSQ